MAAMNRSVDGDIVAVELLPKSQWRAASSRIAPVEGEDVEDETAPAGRNALPTGRVVGIVERKWRQYCGSLEESDKKTGASLFLSVNKKIPKIKINSRQIDVLMDKRILVAIDSWPADSFYPLGHYVRTLGTIGDRDCETQVLLIEHEIPTAPWSDDVLACLPPDDYKISAEELRGRVDLRGHMVFSIDPPGCTDIDDALHVRQLPNGNFEVGVHIADVSHYVKPGTPLDDEASNRCTSVYMVDRRIDMLPALLSTNLCSLRADVDRLAFSCVWELTPTAEIVDTRFHKSVIKSIAAFTYGEAQDRLDKGLTDDVSNCVRWMNNLAKCLKNKRFEAGALSLASTELKFLLDRETQKPTEMAMYQTKEVNSLVEEFMLLANVSVAKQILEHFPNFACLRGHPEPTQEMFLTLVRAAKTVGFDVRTETSKILAESLDKCEMKGFPFFNKLVGSELFSFSSWGSHFDALFF